MMQEFSEYDKQGALLRQARSPIAFQGDEGDEGVVDDDYEDEDDLDFSGGGAGMEIRNFCVSIKCICCGS